MPDKKQIAFYIDVDNCDITYDSFIHANLALQEKGEIIVAKVYGVSERRNKDIFDEIARRGYEVAPPMRIKKRGQKTLDNRIIIDVMEDVLQNTNIEAVAIIAPPADMVYLYRRLQSYNIAIYALDNNDEESSRLVDEFLDVGIVDVLKPLSKKKAAKTIAEKIIKDEEITEENTEESKEENTDKIMEETIEKAEEKTDEISEEITEEITENQIPEETISPVTETVKPSYEVFDEPSQAAATDAKKIDNTQKQSVADRQMAGEFASMLRRIEEAEKKSSETAKVMKEEILEQVDSEPMPGEEKYVPVDSDRILDEVEELEDEATPLDDENAALLEEIKKLLDEFKSE